MTQALAQAIHELANTGRLSEDSVEYIDSLLNPETETETESDKPGFPSKASASTTKKGK